MPRIFVDSSVFFSAAYSTHGHAHDLILMAVREEVSLVVSPLVLAEAERNLFESAPDKLAAFDRIVENTLLEPVRPTKRAVLAASKHIPLKDAPIVAAAVKGKAPFLATFDRRHLLKYKDIIHEAFGITVVTPEELIDIIKA